MRCRILLIAAMLLQPAWSQNGRAQPAFPLAQCAIAIATAERAEALPPGLLGAIGRVESGRYDPVTGSVQPWPWTIDADGIGRQFETEDAAIEAVRGLQAEGVRSIDVGCMQVNLQQHPQAFATLEQAFDPAANAAYAAHFLRVLFAESLDWSTAAGAYHSHTPDIGAPYRQLVLETWGWARSCQSGGPARNARCHCCRRCDDPRYGRLRRRCWPARAPSRSPIPVPRDCWR